MFGYGPEETIGQPFERLLPGELLDARQLEATTQEIEERGHSTGSTDMGDISCIMPTSSIGMGGVKGTGHGRTFEIVDREMLYIVPAKIQALACIDLLFDGAAKAKEIINSFEPAIPPGEYTDFMRKLVS